MLCYFDKISNLYSDLSSITLWGLIKLKEDYKSVNYSTTEIDYQFQKILSYPIYLTIMSLLSIVLMMNLKPQTNKVFVITLGIFISVIICCYNSEKYIIETLKSVINQTYSKYEIIIVKKYPYNSYK